MANDLNKNFGLEATDAWRAANDFGCMQNLDKVRMGVDITGQEPKLPELPPVEPLSR